MQPVIYNLENIKHTKYKTWVEFFEKIKGSQFAQGIATIQYVDFKGHHQETTLEIDPENIKHLAYYEALHHLKQLGLTNFNELKMILEKKGNNNDEYYQHYYITKDKENRIEMHAVQYPVSRIMKFAEIEKEDLMRFVEPPRKNTTKLK